MKNRVSLKSVSLLLLIAAVGLVTASVDDDLIFDLEGKQPAVQAPLIEKQQDESFFHRIKRGFFDFFNPASTTTATTQAPLDQQKEDQDQIIDNAVIFNGDNGNHTLDQPEEPSAENPPAGVVERLTREKDKETGDIDDEHDNEISNVAESQRIPITYGNSDDEDLAGSGEIEGSAGEGGVETSIDHRPSIHGNSDGKIRFYRITLTVGEPYRREYSDRNSLKYRELSGNLTHALENLFNRHIPGYKHLVNVVKISPTSDAFTLQVTLDIGSTFTDETEVRDILEKQLQYHSLGSVQVGPQGFTFRIFQAGERDDQPECDQAAELRCRSGACVPLESRCDGVLQCDDGSDEDNCPRDSLNTAINRTSDADFEHTTVERQPEETDPFHHPDLPTTEFPSQVKPNIRDVDDGEDEEFTLRPSANKCRADDTVRCKDGSRHICSVQQCDGVPDCDDGGDEIDCPHPGCSAGEFACDVNRCILESQQCDFVEDCQDGSDEHDCNYPVCSSNEFICRNRQCIDNNKYCDGVRDCHDGSDEYNCPCREDQFECAPGYCVPLSRRCDGYTDCVGGKDEQNCHNMTRCRADEFECDSGSCVSKNARCDGRNDCVDHSDENNCNVTTCSGDQFRCLDGTCLSIDKRCNGVSDCRNGDDESQCGCGEAEFRCTDGRCIGYELQCNGVNECSDGSDEKDCEKSRGNFYNAKKFNAITQKSPTMIFYGGKPTDRQRNMNMQPKTTKNIYGITVKPAVTISNSILGAFPEKTQRRKFSNFTSQTPSIYSTRIVPKSKDNEHDSLHNMAKTTTRSIDSNMLFIPQILQKNDIKTESKKDSKKDCFGFAIKKGSKRLYYCNKHKNHIKAYTTIISTTMSTNKVNEHAITNLKYDETPEPTLSFTEKIPIIGKINKNDHSIKTEKLLYESNFRDIKLHRYLPNIPKITDDVYKISKNLSTLSHNSFDENNDKIDSGLTNSDETPESVIAKSNENNENDKIDSGLEEGSRDDFGVLLLASTPHFITSESESKEEASIEKHNRHKHKGRHNDRKDNGSKSGKKNYNAKRKQKTTIARKVDETTSVAYDNDYSAERSSTAFSRNDPRYDKADDNPSAGTNDRSDGYLPDEITTKSFKMEFSGVDESGAEYLTKSSTQEGLQSTETTNADLSKKNSKKCKERVTTTTVGNRLTFSNNNKNIDEESTDCEEDVTSLPITSGSEQHKSATGYYITDYSFTYKNNKRKGATDKSSFNNKNNEKNSRISKKLENQDDNIYSDLDSEEEEVATNCDEHQFACDNGTCIEKEQVCDKFPDCPDSSDEADCVYVKPVKPDFPANNSENASADGCADYEHPCNGICINKSNVCDHEVDCADGSDEEGCDYSKSISESTEECPDGKLPCDNGVCINKNFFCDHNIDCHDASDEKNCPDGDKTGSAGQECEHDSFMCRDGSCIPQAAVCDGRADCPQNEDEAFCLRGCTRDQFQCANGDCIRADQRCNGYIECADGSDEPEECGPPEPGQCTENQFTCVSDRRCVPQSSICNGIPECRDGSDEHNCDTDGTSELRLKTYPSEQVIKENPAKQGREVVFQCRDEGLLRARVRWIRGNGLPLPPGSRDISGRLEIPNIQIEHAGTYICEAVGYPPSTPGRQVSVDLTVEKFEQPATRPPEVCQYDQATCSNGDCIPKTHVCDGKFDCTDGSDEMRCSPHGCEPNEFRCNNKQCVSKLWRCDGDKDCADSSDEENCGSSPAGSSCRYNEYACSSNKQCIPKSYHCDMERDCLDGSDEIGCSPVYIVKPPPPMVVLQPGELLVLTCTAIGVPIPEINWRLNWGHIPEKCSMSSTNGTGTLTCPDIQREDQGAYSCEALNIGGFVFAVPDAIVVVKETRVCPKGKFNSEAKTVDECISCFCFGVATECRSADLFTYQIPPPFDRHKIVSVETAPTIRINGDITSQVSQIRPIGRDGVQLLESYSNNLNVYNLPYFALPESYHNSQLKSYGGYLRYTIRYSGNGTPNNAPTVILSGNNYILVHKGAQPTPDYDTEESVRFFYGDWYKQQGRSEILASREEIMMTLANVDNILIKMQYDDSPQQDVRLTNIIMDTADVRNTGLGSASYVEECQCPTGYTGLSCEHCAPGYLRRESGPWLGQCYRDEPPCPPGYYGDPSRNIPCQICPCPHTNPSNQFARTCHLGSDGQPTCDCPPGYVGRRCEQCATGYQGNPLIPGDMCVPLEDCDPSGSLSPHTDPHTGKCHCKQYATGLTCNQCKANTFNLASANQFGCISCFCMGITNRCISSNWYRNDIRVSFTNSIRGFSLIESEVAPAIVEGIHLNTISREIVYSDFPNRGNNDVYYWQLPSIFLGNQITSYGGNLKYTVRYVPSPGGQSSRNNAADVELVSANDINLLYYSRESPEPNSQQSFTVLLLEQYWQRNDGTQADREHLLMALADVKAIRIKATYTTHTDEAALSFVSLDTAEKYNTGKARAVEVEECTCPVGYRGLSCEDCDVGYTRAIEGLYLGICEPCNCNGHSNQCNPESGICENCAHHTTGDFCDVCEPGYEGDATRGTSSDCTYRSPRPEPCRCNEAGSRSTSCVDGRCECKKNVEGSECNRCRPSTYGLRAENIDGCIECYCSGVTDQCHESTLYVQQIPMWVYDSHHGFTLTDSTRRDIINDGFELNVAMNEIGYRYPDSRSRRLFWSLPSVFTGNKVKSYGGNLTLTQHITAYPGAQSYKDQDILLIGNGVTLFWTNPAEIQPDVPLTYSVPLIENEWRRLSNEGPRSASRTDLMIVLSNLEAILVRASHSERMTATYISDISMDTAVENPTGSQRATQVEACRCPTGYTGTSCETCTRGYYRDTSDRSVSYLGACNLCPCNKNEQSCEISRSGHVKCHCLPGYTGQYCQDSGVSEPMSTTEPVLPPRIIVYIQEPEFQIVQTGNTVRYHCMGRSQDRDSVNIRWEKEGGQLPPGRSVDDSNGLLVIRDVKVSDSGIYVCQVSDGINIEHKKVTLTVGGANPEEPRVDIKPSYQQVREGEPVEFRCEASGNPSPLLDWIRVHGSMSPEATFYNGVWRLPAASKNDAAEYKCVARNNVGVNEKTTILYVQDNPNKPPVTGIPPIVTPSEWVGPIGEVVRLVCTPSQNVNVTWTRSGGLPLPYSTTQRNGVLTITKPTPSDSGLYVCTATSARGTETSTSAKITIVPRRDPPIIKVRPERQEVSQGTIAEVRCITSGEPDVQVKWSKYTETMSPRAQQIGDRLRIINVQVSDRGVYICRVSSPTGSHEASAIIEVEPREAPVLELYPQDVQAVTLGGSADLQCRAKAGFPVPELHWSRQDGRPFTPNIEQLPGGLLRLSNITISDGGAYVCSASNEVGSTSVIAHIEVQSMPRITITPGHGILHVKRGSRVRLMCSANGHPQPNVAWSKHVNGRTIHEHSQVAVTPLSAVYEIYSVSPDDEGSYTCQATNAVGIVEERIQIRIEDDDDAPCTGDRGDIPCDNPPPPIGPGDPIQPELIPEDYLRIPNGGKVEMRCQVKGPDGDHIYLDWKRSDRRPLPADSTVHNGVLSIPVVNRNAAGEYICLGLDTSGNVLFRTKSHLEVISPPRIELNPTRQTVGPGENPSIVCTATGDEPLHIKWEAIGRPLPYSVSDSGGMLQFHGITYSDAGKYVCKATNSAGTAEAVAEVLVNEHDDARIRAEQRDVVTYAGNSVTLRCIARERATIHWSREGQALPVNAREVGDYLELTHVRPEDSGRYICQTQTSRGVSSDYINLNVSPTALPSVTVEVSQDPVNIGDTVDIHCTYTGTRNPRYHWSRPNHVSLPPNAQEYGNILRLTKVSVGDSGPYRCTVDTPEGTLEKDFNLIVHGGVLDEPAIETKFAPYGSSLEMDCRIDLDPPIQFQWSKLGGLLPRNSQIVENKLKLTNVKAEDAGTYICVGNNDELRVEVPTVLVVTGVVPNFSQAPESYIAFPPLPDSYLKFNIEISFKPESYDGILLYNDEPGHGNGDFIVLSLVNGYPQFKFNLGSGPAVIRADKPITLSEWHTIKIQRNRKEGAMLVDGEGPYKVVAVGRRQGLDLKEPLYIGGVPSYNNINKEVEANTGFVGCISRLVLGEKQVDLMGDQTDSVGITNCETCAENPCNNGGVCQEAAAKNGYTCLCRAGFSGKHCDYVGQSCYPGVCGEGKCVDKEIGFDCYCPIGKTGSRCEHSVNVYDPAFLDDRAFIAHDTPKALRRERESSTTTHSRLRSRNAQVRKPRSRPHHHNNLHHTKH